MSGPAAVRHGAFRSVLGTALLGLAILPGVGRAQQPTPSVGQTIFQAACALEDEECARDVSRPIVGVARAPVLFNNVQIATHEFLASAVQFDKDKLKLVVTPFKLAPERNALSTLTFNLARQDEAYAAGVGAGYDIADPLGRRGNRLVREVFATVRPAQGQEIENPDTYLDSIFRPAYGEYYRRLLRNSWTISAGINLLLFEELAGRKVDRDNNNVIDNEHTYKGFTFTPSLTYNFSFRTGVGVGYYFSQRRAGAAADDSLATYHGASLTLSHRAILLNRRYWESGDFLTDFFIPSIDVGLAAEIERCSDAATACEDEIERQWALTPFVDIRASPKTQFRLGLSVRRSSLVEGVAGEDETAVGPLLQYMLQLGPSK